METLSVVPWPRTDGLEWGILCLAHIRSDSEPTDYEYCCAKAFAEACQCSYEDHKEH